jgi:Flp pilus assembly protein TadG
MIAMMIAKPLLRRWRALAADRRGVVLVEMAMTLPVVIVIALGGFEIARFALVQQKLERLTVTIADMVSQSETITGAQLNQIFAATGPVLTPFSMSADGVVIVSSVSASGGTGARVSWQRRGGGTHAAASALGTAAQLAALPTGFVVRDGESAIVAESYYEFVPMFIPALVPARRLYHRAMFRPRFGALTSIN